MPNRATSVSTLEQPSRQQVRKERRRQAKLMPTMPAGEEFMPAVPSYRTGGDLLVGATPYPAPGQRLRPARAMIPSFLNLMQSQRQMQRVPERILGVGADSGKVHFQMGDNPNGPELVTVRPPRGFIPPSFTPEAPGVESYAEGGNILVGPRGRSRADIEASGYEDDDEREWYLRGGTNIGPEAQAWLNERERMRNATAQPAPGAAAAPTASSSVQAPGAGDPLQQQLEATRARLAAEQGVIDQTGRRIGAERNVVNARRGTIAPTQGVIDANRGVTTATDAYINSQRGYIGQQQGANQQRLAEQQGIQAAEANTADKIAVAQAQNARNNLDYRYGIGGMALPEEIELAEGDSGEGLPAGVRGKIMSQAELLEKDAKANEAIRSIDLDQARLAVALVGTDVDAARNEAAKAGLTLDEAELLVSQAEIEASEQGLTLDEYQNKLSQARLEEEKIGLPPRAGMVTYTDPNGTTRWVTPGEKATLETMDRNRGQLQLDPATGKYVPAELGALSDTQVASLPFTQGVAGSVGERAAYEAAVAELMRRGYSERAARWLIEMAAPQEESDEDGGIVE